MQDVTYPIESIHVTQDGIKIEFRLPDNTTGSSLFKPSFPIWSRIEWKTGTEYEVHLRLFNPNLLHWGTLDYEVVRVTLPEALQYTFDKHATALERA